jgi:hypothetical protein
MQEGFLAAIIDIWKYIQFLYLVNERLIRSKYMLNVSDLNIPEHNKIAN